MPSGVEGPVEELGKGKEPMITAADLTFASLYAPFTAPPEYGAPLPGFADLPEPFAPLRDTMTARAAGQYTQRMFREHRRGVSGSSPRP